MDHLITCECGQSFPVSRSQAGQELTCTCGKILRIPTLRAFSDLPRVEATATPEPPREITTWGGWRGTALAISVGLFALSALSCVYFSLQRLTLDPSYTVEMDLEAGNEYFDQQNMEQLAPTWTSFENSGLGLKQKPDFYYYNRYARERGWLAIITGSIAAMFALFALGVWRTAK